jgi:hypothetical protein
MEKHVQTRTDLLEENTRFGAMWDGQAFNHWSNITAGRNRSSSPLERRSPVPGKSAARPRAAMVSHIRICGGPDAARPGVSAFAGRLPVANATAGAGRQLQTRQPSVEQLLSGQKSAARPEGRIGWALPEKGDARLGARHLVSPGERWCEWYLIDRWQAWKSRQASPPCSQEDER